MLLCIVNAGPKKETETRARRRNFFDFSLGKLSFGPKTEEQGDKDGTSTRRSSEEFNRSLSLGNKWILVELYQLIN